MGWASKYIDHLVLPSRMTHTTCYVIQSNLIFATPLPTISGMVIMTLSSKCTNKFAIETFQMSMSHVASKVSEAAATVFFFVIF